MKSLNDCPEWILISHTTEIRLHTVRQSSINNSGKINVLGTDLTQTSSCVNSCRFFSIRHHMDGRSSWSSLTLISFCPQVSVPWGTARFLRGRIRYRTRTGRRGRSETSLRAPGGPGGSTGRRLRFWTNVKFHQANWLWLSYHPELGWNEADVVEAGVYAHHNIRTPAEQQRLQRQTCVKLQTERKSFTCARCHHEKLYQHPFNAWLRASGSEWWSVAEIRVDYFNFVSQVQCFSCISEDFKCNFRWDLGCSVL